MEIYIHRQNGEMQLVEAEESTSVAELAQAHGGAEDSLVWVEDAEEPLDAAATLAVAGIKGRSHVHISPCRRITVRVRYGGDSESHEFAPGATVARIFAWATGKSGFDLTPTERAKHTLGICDELTQPDKSEHVGSIAGSECSLCLDLAPKERFEG